MPESSNKLMSILEYYQSHQINPVPIKIEDKKIWENHQIKRQNLYERHLKIPLSMFRDRSVIEFGCNSGENALYLASLGAQLTLVEPNEQVLPRLRSLFQNFGMEGSIVELANTDIAGFNAKKQYDIMIAEGFLTMIPNREAMLLKICSLIAPGGYGSISFDDLYGSFFEVLRQMVFRRVCQTRNIKDLHSEQALAVAKELYGEDFAQLKASRPFEAWWQDVLLNQYVSWDHLGTYPEFLSILKKANCEIHATSPGWTTMDYYLWYKNVLSFEERYQRFLDHFYKAFPFFLVGAPTPSEDGEIITPQEVQAVSDFIKDLSSYNFLQMPFESVSYPALMDKYFSRSRKPELSVLNTELKGLLEVLKTGSDQQMVASYKKTNYLRRSWGMASPYISFKKIA